MVLILIHLNFVRRVLEENITEAISKPMKPLVQKNHLHSDVCRKMNAPSLGGAEYFLTFIDDKT